MNSSVLKEKLKEALLVAERVASKSLSLPILGNILISTKANFLEVSSTDLEIGIRYKILSKNEADTQVVVLSKSLSQFIGIIPGPQVVLKTNNHGLLVESDDFHAQFKTLSAEDFPIIPSPKESEELVELETKAFCQGMASVMNFTGQTQMRPEISGVFFLFQKNMLKLASTDSFRLAENTMYLKKEVGKETSFILPAKAARELVSVLGERAGSTKIFFSATQVIFDYSIEGASQEPKIQIVSRLIEGEYPKYQDVIPANVGTKAVLKREEFLNHVKAASVFSGKMNDVRVLVDPARKGVEINSKNADLGENTSFLKGQVRGDRIEVAFNWRFLGDGLSQIKSEEVELGITTEDGPAILRPIQDEKYLYVVMPIKA